MHQQDSRNSPAAALILVAAIGTWGCVSIKDGTPEVLQREADGTLLLTASIDTFGTQPTSVTAAIGMREFAMTAAGGGTWQVRAPLDACLRGFQLRYLVQYPTAVGSAPATEIEPAGATDSVGGFLKTVAASKNCGPSTVFTVNSEDDERDTAPGDGFCDANPVGTVGTRRCTLVAAIHEANSSAGPATIRLPAGTYTTTTGYFAPTDDLVIEGSGSDSIIGAHVSIASAHSTPPTVELRNLTLLNGVRSVGSLLLNRVTVRDGRPTNMTAAGVTALGLLYIQDSSIVRNNAVGLYLRGSHGKIVGSLIADNGEGGGIECAPHYGASSELEIANSTITGNRGKGGLIVGEGCSARLRNVTIAGNQATLSSASSRTGGGLTIDRAASVVLSNTILADNTNTADPASPNCAATFGGMTTSTVMLRSLGHNLVGTLGSCRLNSGLGRPDLVGLSASLGPLADHGGPTKTLLPLAGSPARGAGAADPYNDAFPPACPRSDQRGVARSGACDIGAIQAPP